MSSIEREGKPAPAPGACALRHLYDGAYPPPSGKRSPLPRKQGSPHGHRHRGGRTPRCYVRHRSIATKRCYSASRIQAHKQGSTREQAALTGADQLLPLLRHASEVTTLARDRRPSTSAAKCTPLSRWKTLGASERKAAT